MAIFCSKNILYIVNVVIKGIALKYFIEAVVNKDTQKGNGENGIISESN